MPIFGWDASDYDWGRGPMDVAAAVRDGIVWFTYKATEGTRTQHVHYGEAMRRARAAGMPLMGAYMVPRTPGNNGHGTIAQQVDYFLSYLDAQTPWWRSTPGFFLQVDTEHWGYDDVAPEYGAQACALLRAQTGKWVVHYAPRWGYGDTIPGDDPLWASSYGTNPAVPYRQGYPGDASSGWAPYSGRTPVFLQYGSRLTIGGQPGCDANAFRGSLDQLRALVGAAPTLHEETSVIQVIDNGPDPKSCVITDLSTFCNRRFSWEYLESLHQQGMPRWIVSVGQMGDLLRLPEQPVDQLNATVADLTTKIATLQTASTQASGAPTQAQVDAAMLKALQDPSVINALGAAVASHLHVS